MAPDRPVLGRKARSQALNQMRSIIATAPEPIWAEPRNLKEYGSSHREPVKDFV